jgi:MerR family redox-sensitive transcriptional activator SoxR
VTPASLLSIGELSRRTGMSVSAIRFYETRGLVKAIRTTGNQRRFMRADIRRLSFAQIAQRLGLTLTEIEAELATLPQGRAPTRQDWQAISARIRDMLQGRIEMLRKTRDLLDSCIGCGCLSLDRCALYNPNDRAARAGAGPRFLLGDRAQDFDDAELKQVRGSTVPGSAGKPPRRPGPTPHRQSRHSRRGG